MKKYALVSDITPNRCTVVALSESFITLRFVCSDTQKVLRVAKNDHVTPGQRAYLFTEPHPYEEGEIIEVVGGLF